MPLALVGLLTGLWVGRRAPRVDLERAGWLLFGGWAAVCGLVFSFTSGTFHAHYTVQLAPAIAALAGAGVAALWRMGTEGSREWAALPAAMCASVCWAMVLLSRDPSFADWLAWPVAVATIVGAGGLASERLRRIPRVRVAACAIAGAALLAGPFAYTVTTVLHPMTGSDVERRPAPRRIAPQRITNPADTPSNRHLVAYLGRRTAATRSTSSRRSAR